jgi:hypothetical protein
MRRREFLTAGAIAAAAATLSADGNAQRANASQDYSVGDFILRRLESGLQIRHTNKSDRVLWETVSDGNFITAENAVVDVKDFGTPMGFFSITDSCPCRMEIRRSTGSRWPLTRRR